ncbi:tryptophan-rich sensory protein [Microbacterium sp. NPDC055910]|uniref:tryptophan-rich sensory protein n=1 Tax=Microbacterium sp. NPDC055910 TaxID=3345659 RepID=UPI0035DF1D8F
MAASSKDLTRQIAVISATVFMVISSLAGRGLIGDTPVEDAQGGALDSDATLLTPASTAFAIWSAIYVLMIGYAIWQALPNQRTRERQRAIGWWIALSAVLNGVWILLALYTTLLVSVIGIVALLIVLCIAFQRTVAYPAEGFLDSFLTDLSVGLHLGWVSLATVANVSAWLTEEGPAEWADAGTPIGVAVVIVVGLIGLAVAWRSGWHVSPGLALAWGLGWVAYNRLALEPRDTAIGVTAIIVGVLVILVPVVATLASRVVGARNAEA